MVFDTPEGQSGGIMNVDKVEPGKSPYIYIEVDDIDTYLERAKALGGGVDVPRTEIPQVGWYAHVTDQDRNIYGLLEPKKR
jgi:predicted enzyme related to lactoylglutathione lyase